MLQLGILQPRIIQISLIALLVILRLRTILPLQILLLEVQIRHGIQIQIEQQIM
jgi:hypothetical protein